jgi:putative DNA methylase
VKKEGGKDYRLPIDADYKAMNSVEFDNKYNNIKSFIPTEEIPYLRSIFNVYVYGIRKWADLFTRRQQLAIASFIRIITRLPGVMGAYDQGLKDAVCTCLGLAVDRLADFNSNIARWANHRETSAATFGRQALGMVWDVCETIPIADSTGSFLGSVDWIVRICEAIAKAKTHVGFVQQASAIKYPLADDIASIIFTDPPYYDAVPYANLSDFFYVWLKRSIGAIHPDLLSTTETPKNGEAVQLAERNEIYAYKTRSYFEELMAKAFNEGRRYVHPNGLGIFVFAHKSTEAWETLLIAVIDSGWTVTASWAIDTEMGSRLRAMNSAALASSIHLVCRPRHFDGIGDWRSVLAELPKRIHDWMPRLAEEGVVGADAIFACLGPALEIFSRYSSVEKASGEKVFLKEYLEQVWAAVAKEALSLIFSSADTAGFEEDARLTAMWLWTLKTVDVDGTDSSTEDAETEDDEETGKKSKVTGGFALEYDAARKIAQGLGVNLENLHHLVLLKGDTAILFPVSARTKYLFGKDSAEAPKGVKKKKREPTLFDFDEEFLEQETDDWTGELKGQAGNTILDQLHQSMILFAANRSEALKRFLVEDGIGGNPLYWKLAQALSALYPTGTDEKRWVDGVLAKKKGFGF